jgi:hypothetical protein
MQSHLPQRPETWIVSGLPTHLFCPKDNERIDLLAQAAMDVFPERSHLVMA